MFEFSKHIDVSGQLGNVVQSTQLATVAFSGDYNDVQNTPYIPTILTDLDTTVTGTQLENMAIKLGNIEPNATADQTDGEIKTAYENNTNTNAFTDSEKTKLASIEGSKFLGTYTSLNALQTAHPSPGIGSYGYVDAGTGNDVTGYIWDDDDNQFVEQGASSAETASSIKTKYESNADTNAYTDTEETKVSNLPANTNAELANKVNSGALATVATTGNYSDLSGKLTSSDIATLYHNNNNVNQYTNADHTKLNNIEPNAEVNVQSDRNATSGDAKILNTPTLATVATSGDYTDLSNTPSIPSVLTDLNTTVTGGELNTIKSTVDNLDTVATTGNYSDLSGTPSIPTALTDLDTTVTGSQLNSIKQSVDGLSTVASSGSYNDLSDTPSDADIKTSYENNSNTNAFTDSEKTKLSNLEGSKFLGTYTNLNQLQTAHPSPDTGSYAFVDAGQNVDVDQYIRDDDDNKYVVLGSTQPETPASIKTKYESNADTNAYTDSEESKVGNLPANTISALAGKADASSLATVATSGDYSDLSGTPSIPSALSDLDTTVTGTELNGIKSTVNGLATVATTGDYTDLTNVPSTFTPSSHTHTVSEINDFDNNLAGTSNTTAFTPSANYHPATKKYVDDAIVQAGGYNDEKAQDAVGTILTDTSEIDFTYSDGVPSIKASLKSSSIDESKLDSSVNTSLNKADSALQSGDNISVLNDNVGYEKTSNKGSANGYAGLNSSGTVPTSQLPSSVDEILEYANKSSFPGTGEASKIYVAKDTNKTYRWSGSAYTEISASIALGTTSSTAYRGDRGQIAYQHSQVSSGNPHSVTASDIGVEPGATTDQTEAEIETAYNNRVSVVSKNDAEAGTSTDAKRRTPQRVHQAIDATISGGLTTPSFIKLSSSDTSTNMNTTSFTPIPLDENIYEEGTKFTHSTSNNNSRITVKQTGYYRVIFNARLDVGVARDAPQFAIRKNGSSVFGDDRVSHTYMRDSSGHNNSTANLTALIKLNANDYIEIGNSGQDGSNGSTTLAGQTSVTVEKFEVGLKGDTGPQGPAGGVDSVNTQTGTVVLDTDDISDSGATNKYVTQSQISNFHNHSNKSTLDNISAAFTTNMKSKLSGIEPNADVTDSANVNAAGATMNTDTNVSSNNWVLDQDDMSSDDNTKVPTQQSVKAYVDSNSPTSGDMEALGVDKTTDTSFSTSWTDIGSWDTERITTSDISFNTTTGIVTFDNAGRYLITANFSLDPTGGGDSSGDRSEAATRMVLDTGSGYAEVSGTQRLTYHREGDEGGDNCTITWIIDASAGDDIKFQSQKISGALTIAVEDASINVVKLTGAKGDIGPAGGVDTAGTPADNQIAVFTNSNTVEGTSDFIFDGTKFSVQSDTTTAETRVFEVKDGNGDDLMWLDADYDLYIGKEGSTSAIKGPSATTTNGNGAHMVISPGEGDGTGNDGVLELQSAATNSALRIYDNGFTATTGNHQYNFGGLGVQTHVGTLDFSNITSNRTYDLPDKSGTIALEGLDSNDQTGTSYTLALSDNNKVVTLDNSNAITLTVPPNSSVAFPVGAIINFEQLGAGQVTFAEGSGVTINSKDGNLKLSGQYSGAYLRKTGSNEWILVGDLTS